MTEDVECLHSFYYLMESLRVEFDKTGSTVALKANKIKKQDSSIAAILKCNLVFIYCTQNNVLKELFPVVFSLTKERHLIYSILVVSRTQRHKKLSPD